jgi:hypothetical protein
VDPPAIYALVDDAHPTVTFTLRIRDAGYAPLTWTAVESPTVAWMSLSPASGPASLAAQGYVDVVVTTDGLAADERRQAQIVVTSTTPYVQASPQTVNVSLHYMHQLQWYYIPTILKPGP